MFATDLTPVINGQKTLVITCIECNAVIRKECTGELFICTALGSAPVILNDALKETIRYFITERRCTQIIVLGHVHCKVLHYMLRTRSHNPGLRLLKNRLKMYRINPDHKLRETAMEKILVEANVIQQAELILNDTFIRVQATRCVLTVRGVVFDEQTKKLNEIFYNGIPLNSLLSLQ